MTSILKNIFYENSPTDLIKSIHYQTLILSQKFTYSTLPYSDTFLTYKGSIYLQYIVVLTQI